VIFGVNFSNILQAPFSYESVIFSFSLLKICVTRFFWQKDIGQKAAQKMLMKFNAKPTLLISSLFILDVAT